MMEPKRFIKLEGDRNGKKNGDPIFSTQLLNTKLQLTVVWFSLDDGSYV